MNSITRPKLQRVNLFDRWLEIHPNLGISIMDYLFNRLDGAYLHKWRKDFQSPQAVDNWAESWAEAFEAESITLEDIATGLNACRSRFDWPPSCAEFIKSCRLSIDPIVAYHEAVEGFLARERGEIGHWSHPATYWAAMCISVFDFRTQSYAQIKSRWEKALRDQVVRRDWPLIPQPMTVLPEWT